MLGRHRLGITMNISPDAPAGKVAGLDTLLLPSVHTGIPPNTDPISYQSSYPNEPQLRHARAAEICELTHALMHARQTVSPRRLDAPGPNVEQFNRLLLAAAAAPDHGLLVPWRFVVVPLHKREALGEVFALALIDRDPGATLAQIEDARSKAQRAPLLMLAIARLGIEEPNTPPLERMISMGCAVQNILLSAQAMGFRSGLTSGRAINSQRMRELFSLAIGEEAVCFVNIGTAGKEKQRRLRPLPERFVSTLS